MDTFQIRPATPEDVSAIAACAQEAFAIYVPRMGKKPAPMLVDYRACLDEHIVHVAEEAGGIVGFIVLREHGQAILLDTVALLPSSQGKGLGRKFMEFAENFAVKRGKPEIFLYTNQLMTENQSFYAKAGYSEYDRKVEDGFARIYYRKKLKTN